MKTPTMTSSELIAMVAPEKSNILWNVADQRNVRAIIDCSQIAIDGIPYLFFFPNILNKE